MLFVLLYVTYVHSSFVIILMGKRELVALLGLSSWCLVIVVWFFLTVSRVCLRRVIVVFPDQTLLLVLVNYNVYLKTLYFTAVKIKKIVSFHSHENIKKAVFHR